MTQESDKALEKKAREWLKQMRLTPRYYVPSLVSVLREVAEEAKREEAAEWERVVREAQEKWARPGYGTTAVVACDEILRRRGVK